jgi:hypothetical protein
VFFFVGGTKKKLETEIVEKNGERYMKLFGTTSPYTHQAYMPPVDNHESGLHFQVNCRNRHRAVNGETFWRSYLTPRQAKDLFVKSGDEEETSKITICGDFRQVPNSPVAELTATLRHVRGTGHVIDSVTMEFPARCYNLFFDRIKF